MPEDKIHRIVLHPGDRLRPGERIIDGRVYYSAAWLGDTPLMRLANERAEENPEQRQLFPTDPPQEAA